VTLSAVLGHATRWWCWVDESLGKAACRVLAGISNPWAYLHKYPIPHRPPPLLNVPAYTCCHSMGPAHSVIITVLSALVLSFTCIAGPCCAPMQSCMPWGSARTCMHLR
jgi:hypothetical protein